MTLETAPAGANNAFVRNHTENATIASGETTSDEIILGGRAVVNIHLPTMTAGYISYLVKINPGDTPVVLVDDSDDTITFPRGSSATSTGALVYQEPRLSGVYSVQLVSSAAQGSERVIGISARGQNPIPTVTDIEVAVTVGTITPVPSALSGAASSVYSPISSVVTAAAIKGSAGNVFKILATNANAAARWFQLHNKATIPLATEVPLRSWKIPAGTANNPGYVEFEFKYANAFSTGIGFALSTTQATFTDAATASESTVTVEYL